MIALGQNFRSTGHIVATAAELIQQFTAGKSHQDYSIDTLLRSGVERQFEIVGEAMRRLAVIDLSTASRSSEYQRIIAFRNILIHGYDAVDASVAWDVVQNNLPKLLDEVGGLLDL